jgi:hypothetical protein
VPAKPNVHQHTCWPLTILHTPLLRHVKLQNNGGCAIIGPRFKKKIYNKKWFIIIFDFLRQGPLITGGILFGHIHTELLVEFGISIQQWPVVPS